VQTEMSSKLIAPVEISLMPLRAIFLTFIAGFRGNMR